MREKWIETCGCKMVNWSCVEEVFIEFDGTKSQMRLKNGRILQFLATVSSVKLANGQEVQVNAGHVLSLNRYAVQAILHFQGKVVDYIFYEHEAWKQIMFDLEEQAKEKND